MKVDFKILFVILLALCVVAESEGWWSRKSSSSRRSSSSRSSSSSSSSRRSSSSSRSSSRSRRRWFRRPRRPSQKRKPRTRAWLFGRLRRSTASPRLTTKSSKIKLPSCSLRFGTACIWKKVTTKPPTGPTKTPTWCSLRFGFCWPKIGNSEVSNKAPGGITTTSRPRPPLKSSISNSKNSCPLSEDVKKQLISKNIPETIHHCLETAPQQCCALISVTATSVLHFIDNWPKYLAVAPQKAQIAIVTAVGVNFIYKKVKQEITKFHIRDTIKKKVTKIDLVERPLLVDIILKLTPVCSKYVIRCLQKSNMLTTLRNEQGEATHSAALLYTEDGKKYLIEKGGTLGTNGDRRQIRRVLFLTSRWANITSITPVKRRTVQEYYQIMKGSYDVYNDNCHDGTKAVERLAKSSD